MGRTDDANEVIARFGGQSALARALGVNQSTVQHWSKTGHVPSWRREQIARAAEQQGIVLGTGGTSAVARSAPATVSRALAESGARRLGSGTVARPVMGYARSSASPGHAPAPMPAPLVHGRADTVVLPDKEIGALREEIVQLRALVEQLVGVVEELRAAAKPRRSAPAGGRRAAGKAQSPRSKSARS